MKFILGKKIAMSQQFKADGQMIPVTIVKAGPCFISKVKSNDSDGYQAIQIGLGEKKKTNKPMKGQFKSIKPARYIKEFRTEGDKTAYQTGQQISVQVFESGDMVDVSAVSKGKGFQGVVKRHGFSGAPKTHGDKDQLRHGGSIGSQRPQRVLKNKRMAGRMGGDRVTVKNLEIIEVDANNGILYIKGAIPGSRNGLVEIVAPGEMKLQDILAVPEVKEPVVEEKLPADTAANIINENQEKSEPVK